MPTPSFDYTEAEVKRLTRGDLMTLRALIRDSVHTGRLAGCASAGSSRANIATLYEKLGGDSRDLYDEWEAKNSVHRSREAAADGAAGAGGGRGDRG